MELSREDYELIIRHYGRRIPRTRRGRGDLRKMKRVVNNIMINKLCRCIKAVTKKEKAAVAICTKSIFKNRGLKHFRFTCKKKRSLRFKKGTRKKLVKTKKIHFR